MNHNSIQSKARLRAKARAKVLQARARQATQNRTSVVASRSLKAAVASLHRRAEASLTSGASTRGLKASLSRVKAEFKRLGSRDALAKFVATREGQDMFAKYAFVAQFLKLAEEMDNSDLDLPLDDDLNVDDNLDLPLDDDLNVDDNLDLPLDDEVKARARRRARPTTRARRRASVATTQKVQMFDFVGGK